MNNIQKLIEEITERKLKADKVVNDTWGSSHYDRAMNRGASWAFNLVIDKLNLLLKHDESKQPQPPDFANTMLGEVPHEVNERTKENSKAVEGATPVVRQNEQTKKVCEGCSAIVNEDEVFCEACLEDIDEFLEP